MKCFLHGIAELIRQVSFQVLCPPLAFSHLEVVPVWCLARVITGIPDDMAKHFSCRKQAPFPFFKALAFQKVLLEGLDFHIMP